MLYFRYANADPEIRKAAIYKNRNGGKKSSYSFRWQDCIKSINSKHAKIYKSSVAVD